MGLEVYRTMFGLTALQQSFQWPVKKEDWAVQLAECLVSSHSPNPSAHGLQETLTLMLIV